MPILPLFPSHCVKGPEEEKQQTQTQNVNPLIICERKDGFDAAFIQITEPELTSEKNTEASSLLLLPPHTPRRPSILTFSRLILRRGSILRGRRRCQSHSLQGDPASNDCHIRTSGETARTHAPPPRPLLFSLSAKGKASKQVKALSQLLFS